MYVDVSVAYYIYKGPSAYHMHFCGTKKTYFLFTVEKRKENITDLPRQGGQKKKMGEHFSERNKYHCSTDNFRL